MAESGGIGEEMNWQREGSIGGGGGGIEYGLAAAVRARELHHLGDGTLNRHS